MNHKSVAAFFLAVPLLVGALGQATELQQLDPLADCEAASAGCRKACAATSVYDPDRDGYLKQSDFRAKCELSCTAGMDSCQGQDSKLSCKTGYFHCTGSCPWSVTDTYARMRVSHTNSFQQCSNACLSGYNDCQTVQVKLPPRRRSASFSSCGKLRAPATRLAWGRGRQHRTRHGDGGLEFSGSLRGSLRQGCAELQSKFRNASVRQLSQSCAASCPPTVSDSDGNVLPAANSLKRCTYACQLGASFCKALLQ